MDLGIGKVKSLGLNLGSLIVLAITSSFVLLYAPIFSYPLQGHHLGLLKHELNGP